MPITKEHRRESLSLAYIQAVAVASGMTCSFRCLDYGIDVTLHEIVERFGILSEWKKGISPIIDAVTKSNYDHRMPRTTRITPGGMVFHVLNRANNRQTIFESEDDYWAFLRVVQHAQKIKPMRILSYCVLPNHWHFLLWPKRDGELAAFMHYLTVTHVRRWRLHRESVGEGHVYQGTYKSFPVQDNDHFLAVGRYVEQNALRAGLIERAEFWRFGSLWQRRQIKQRPPVPVETLEDYPELSRWPTPCPANWLATVNRPQSNPVLKSIRTSVHRGRPYGDAKWQQKTARRLGLESTFRPRGRPKKSS